MRVYFLMFPSMTLKEQEKILHIQWGLIPFQKLPEENLKVFPGAYLIRLYKIH